MSTNTNHTFLGMRTNTDHTFLGMRTNTNHTFLIIFSMSQYHSSSITGK